MPELRIGLFGLLFGCGPCVSHVLPRLRVVRAVGAADFRIQLQPPGDTRWSKAVEAAGQILAHVEVPATASGARRVAGPVEVAGFAGGQQERLPDDL